MAEERGELTTTGSGYALGGSVELRPLGLGLSDHGLLPLVLGLCGIGLGLVGQGPLVPETVNQTGAKSAVPEDLDRALAGTVEGT